MTEWIVLAEKELEEEEVAYLKDHGARELVRCKDCKYFDGEGCDNVSSICKGIDTYADWFCAEGRKKDGETKENSESCS